MALNLLANFVSRHSPQQRPFCRHCPGTSSSWALYVAASNVTLHSRQRIKPFTANKTLSGPLLPVMGPFYPIPYREVWAWFAPALAIIDLHVHSTKQPFLQSQRLSGRRQSLLQRCQKKSQHQLKLLLPDTVCGPSVLRDVGIDVILVLRLSRAEPMHATRNAWCYSGFLKCQIMTFCVSFITSYYNNAC